MSFDTSKCHENSRFKHRSSKSTWKLVATFNFRYFEMSLTTKFRGIYILRSLGVPPIVRQHFLGTKLKSHRNSFVELSPNITAVPLTSTSGVIVTGLLRGTTSPSRDFIATMVLHPSSKATLWIPAKSFFKCDWMTSGFVAWPRISNKSSSPMK